MIKWIKNLFTKRKEPSFDKFLKQLVKERKIAKGYYTDDDTGPH